MKFTITIAGAGFKGEAGNFDWENNFIRKYENVNNVLRKNNIKKISEIIKKDIKAVTKLHKWKSIPNAIISEQTADNEAIITVSKDKMQVAKYLNFGTKTHFVSPKKKLALRWIVKGKKYFSKGHYVRGIIAYSFFKLTPKARFEIQQYISNLKKLYK